MQLKMYTSQEYQFGAPYTYTEDIGFALSEENISTHPSNSKSSIIHYLDYYDGIGYVLLIVLCVSYSRYSYYNTIGLAKSDALPLSYHNNNILLCIALMGLPILIYECIKTFTKKSPSKMVWYFTFFLYVFYPTLYAFIGSCMYRAKTIKKKSIIVILLGNMFITLLIATYLLIIFHFTLPTFLLLLVHPVKVITTFAYLITSTFAAIIVCSGYVLAYRHLLYVYFKFKKCDIRLRICLIVTDSIFFGLISIFIVAMFIMYLILICPLVYVLMLSQSSSTITAPIYTILSLVPSAAAPFFTWIFTTKLFHSVSIEKLQNAECAEDTTELTDTNDLNADTEEERLPLLTVEENSNASETAPRSESSPNLHNRHNYGATNAEDRSSETNC